MDEQEGEVEPVYVLGVAEGSLDSGYGRSFFVIEEVGPQGTPVRGRVADGFVQGGERGLTVVQLAGADYVAVRFQVSGGVIPIPVDDDGLLDRRVFGLRIRAVSQAREKAFSGLFLAPISGFSGLDWPVSASN